MDSKRKFTFAFLALAAIGVGILYAMEIGPFIVSDSNGSPLHILNTSGFIQNSGAKQMTSSSNWVLQTSGGTAKAGWTPTGVLLSLDNNDSRGSLTMDGTGEVTQTFDTAEADTNYDIIGTLASTTGSVTDALCVKDKTTTWFSVKNDPKYSSTVSFKWIKIRSAQ